MAQMHPPHGPKDGTRSNAERKLYRVLRDLPADWHVIHSVERFGKAGNGKLVKGEIDFLVIHPDFGILVLEIKGGRITYDDQTGKWMTTDRENATHPLTPAPFEQVDASVRALKTFLKNTLNVETTAYPLARAVWFYDVEWQPRGLLQFPDELILDRGSLADAQGAIERAFAYNGISQEADKLSPEAIGRLLEHLVPDFPPPTLSEAISLDQRLIDLLTQEQSDRLIGLLKKQRQCAIPGEAGTGKTILAFETARQLALAHWRTLLVCVNAFQAHWLKEKQDAECDVNEEFTICDIAELCSQYAKRAGLNDAISAEQVVEAKGQNHLARILQRSVERLQRANRPGEWQYDAVLIDEGQDVEKPLLSAISHLLRDRRNGYFCIWYDPYPMQNPLKPHEYKHHSHANTHLTPVLTPILMNPHFLSSQTSTLPCLLPVVACLA
ncbi:MAG: NERD domain-containing protein [Ktedonobacterales bacterium]|nr:NERD domain-containing protein [Ktedonobacterales bacterium]